MTGRWGTQPKEGAGQLALVKGQTMLWRGRIVEQKSLGREKGEGSFGFFKGRGDRFGFKGWRLQEKGF
jgi:hypothetical protein